MAAVQGIATTWASLGLDMAEYKATFKLRSTEEVFAALEDNMVTLSTMKASRFFAVFEKDITLWEKTLSLVSETIELVLTVSHNLSTTMTASAAAFLPGSVFASSARVIHFKAACRFFLPAIITSLPEVCNPSLLINQLLQCDREKGGLKHCNAGMVCPVCAVSTRR